MIKSEIYARLNDALDEFDAARQSGSILELEPVYFDLTALMLALKKDLKK